MHLNIDSLCLQLFSSSLLFTISSSSSSSSSIPPTPSFCLFCRPQFPGVISKESIGDSVLSLKSLRNRPCSLLSSVVCSFLSIPFYLPPLSFSPATLACSLLPFTNCKEKSRTLIDLFPPQFLPQSLCFALTLSLQFLPLISSLFLFQSLMSSSFLFSSLSIFLMLLSLSPSNHDLSIFCHLPFPPLPVVRHAFVTWDVHVNPLLFSTD